MGKKYTMQDIANAAGVSKATVSYVLNDKKGSRISETTRKKILQTANLYQYVPNLSAKHLGESKKLIGIIVGYNSENSFINEYKILRTVFDIFNAQDHKLVLLDYKKQNNYMDLAYDCIISIDLNEKDIENIGQNTFSPMILFDSMFSDTLYFKIVYDYSQAVKKAMNSFGDAKSCALIYPKRNNEGINRMMQDLPIEKKMAFTGNNRHEIDEFMEQNGNLDFIAIGDTAGFIALSKIPYERLVVVTIAKNPAFPKQVRQIVFDSKQMSDCVRTVFSKLEKRAAEQTEQHIFYIDADIQ